MNENDHPFSTQVHNGYVRAVVPPLSLLDIDLTNETAHTSWTRLATFLGKPIPEKACLEDHCRFPELVDRTSSKQYQLPRKANLEDPLERAHCARCDSACMEDPVSFPFQPSKRKSHSRAAPPRQATSAPEPSPVPSPWT